MSPILVCVQPCLIFCTCIDAASAQLRGLWQAVEKAFFNSLLPAMY
jgi:hypothetical protein